MAGQEVAQVLSKQPREQGAAIVIRDAKMPLPQVADSNVVGLSEVSEPELLHLE